VVRDPEQVRTAPAELRCPSEATGCPQIAQQGSPCGCLCGTVLTLKFLIMPLPWFWIMLLW
jgi:hypothetical protein